VRNATIDRYIERLLADSTPARPIWNLESLRQGKPAHWNYIDGCMMTALWSLFEQTGDTRYRDFAAGFYDYYIAGDGTPLGYSLEKYNIDDINSGRLLFDLYPFTGQEKFKRAIGLLARQLESQPRIRQGNYWHKLIYPNQVWLDGLYMAQVFATRRALNDNDTAALADVSRQFAVVRERLWVEEKRLYCHGYDESRSVFWADPVTGRSAGHWLRAIGWFLVALADVLGYRHDDALAAQLREACDGLLPYLDEETAMFRQVVDAGNRPGNYSETSGSAMAAYTFLKGARLGVLPAGYRDHGARIFQGICRKYLSEGEAGLNLGGICRVAGLGPAGDTRRDGSYEYYISEPVVENDAKGVGPFLMCYTEILQLEESK
jgi:unsaturated rhamnogalacturonyl hydrolase